MSRTLSRVAAMATLFALILPGLIPLLLIAPTSEAMTTEAAGNRPLSVSTHVMTLKEVEKLSSSIGVRQDGKNYNVIIDGYGTGLAPPTSTEWADMVGSATVTDGATANTVTSTSSYDISAQSYFPPVGNQGSQGSCAAWAMTYYSYGYLEAKDNGWTDASTGNPAHLMSPAWTYNMLNAGLNAGTFMDNNAKVITSWGVPSMATMPYVVSDITSWGSEAAFREAPLHRALSYSYLNYNTANGDSTITSIKALLASDVPVTFTIDASQFGNGFDNDYVIDSSEYNSSTYNHAQTLVGYDDYLTDPGHPNVGAFKVVNSWGSTFGDHGYYWVTYDAIKEMGAKGLLFLTYITDRADYQPVLVAEMQFSTAPSRDVWFTVGIGAVGGTTKVSPIYAVNYPYPTITSKFPAYLLLDISDLQGTYTSGVTGFYLTMGATKTSGTISSFTISQYLNGYGNPATRASGQSPDVPALNPCTVTVSMTSGSLISVPGSPTNLEASQTLGRIALAWTAPTSNGGSALTGYSVYRGTSMALNDQALIASVTMNSFADTTAATGTTYYYTVKANNAVGASAPSGSISIQAMGLPGTPGGISAVTSNSSVTLSWTAPLDIGHTAITGYKVYRSTLSGSETLLVALGPVLSYRNTGIANGQAYYYKISAINAMGEGDLSSEVSATPATVPNAPSISGIVGSNGTATISWNAPNNGGSAITSYGVYRGTGSSFSGATLLSSSVTGLTYVDASLQSGKTYYYFVTATNKMGTSAPSSASAIRLTSAPSEPNSLQATSGANGIVLTWSSPSVAGTSAISGYKVYRYEIAGPETLIAALGNVLTFTDTSAIVGHTYHYSIAAVNSDGTGAGSAELAATFVQTPSATTLMSVTGSVGTATLKWTAPSSNGGSALIAYVITMWTSGGNHSVIAQVDPSATTYAASGLTNGAQYWFSVTAVNTVGSGPVGNSLCVVPGSVPGVPANLSLKAGDGIVTVSWSAPTSSGGITDYRYLVWRTSGGVTQLFANLTGSTLSVIDGSVTAGMTYAYSVQAKNVIGCSSSIGPTMIVAGKVPTAPLNLLSTLSSSSVQLSWSPPSYDGSMGITGYKVYRNDGSVLSLLTTLAGTTNGYTDISVSNGKTYSYQLSACNSIGEGPLSAASSCMVTIAAPGIFSLTSSVGDRSVTLYWTTPANGVTSYNVYRTNGGVETLLASLSGTSYQYNDSMLVAGTDYVYRVVAVNAGGSTSSGSVSVHAVYSVNMSLQTTTSNKGVQALGYILMNSNGKAVGGQKVIIYHAIGTADWVQAAQLTTAANGKYSVTIKEPTGASVRIKAVLVATVYHGSLSQEKTLTMIALKNAGTANIESVGSLQNAAYDANSGSITFSMEASGSAIISIPIEAVGEPSSIVANAGGVQKNLNVSVNDGFYMVTVNGVDANEIVIAGIGAPGSDASCWWALYALPFIIAGIIGYIFLARRRRA